MKNNRKIELGHKPDMDEVKILVGSFIKAGNKKLKQDIKEFKEAKTRKDRETALVAIGMSFTLMKTGMMMNKYIDDGVLEDMNGIDKLTELLDSIKDEKKKENDDEDSNDNEDKFCVTNMDETDLEYSFNIINKSMQNTATKLKDKFGGKNAVKLVSGYCKLFVDNAEAAFKGLNDDEDEDEDDTEYEPEIPVKNMKKVKIEDAIKEMRKEGLKDVADALEKIAEKDSTTEINVFKIKDKEEE